jgi:hypothetical protein
MDVASSVITFIHSFVKICQLVQNLKGLGRTHTHIHTHIHRYHHRQAW